MCDSDMCLCCCSRSLIGCVVGEDDRVCNVCSFSSFRSLEHMVSSARSHQSDYQYSRGSLSCRSYQVSMSTAWRHYILLLGLLIQCNMTRTFSQAARR